MEPLRLLSFFTLLTLLSAHPAPQFGFLGNFLGGFLGNRGQAGQAGVSSGGSSGGGGGCGGGHRPNHQFGGQNFLVSWKIGCNDFTQSQGESFCRQNGMRALSIDSASKEREFKALVAREGQRFYWTGGRVSGRNISWPSGRPHSNVEWSHTGGAGRAQPDNREGDETCLAVLNNFYNDGVKFHDVSCHHRKPVICEA